MGRGATSGRKAGEGGQFLGGRFLEAAAGAAEPGFEALGDGFQFGRVDAESQRAKLGGIEFTKGASHPFELGLEAEHGFEERLAGFFGTTDDQAFLAADDLEGPNRPVEAEADDGRAKPTGMVLAGGRHRHSGGSPQDVVEGQPG